MTRVGPACALGALVAGILAGEARGPGSAGLAVGVAVALLVAALRWRGGRGFLIALVGCALLGGAVMQRALHGLAVSPLVTATELRTRVVLEGTLADDPSGPRFEVQVLVRLGTVDGVLAGDRTVLLVGGGDVTSRLRVLEAGDHVTVEGTLEPLSGFDTRYRWRHAVARVQVTDLVDFGPPRSPLGRLANSARAAVLGGGSALPATERALLAGFLLGDTRALPDDLVHDFRDAGLSHLLAVSGANVAFVLAIAGPLLRRLRLGSRLALGLGVLVLFGTMTRWEPSVLRASAMAGIAMGATFIGRPAPASRLLAYAAFGLLVADPFLVHSVGFLLSCGAAAGIVVLAPAFSARIPGPRVVGEALGVTAAAQIGVLPVILSVFGTMPLIALPANLFAAPIVGPLTVWGLVMGVLGGLLGPGVARVVQLPTYALLRWVETVARVSASEPIAIDGRDLCGLVALGCLGAVLLRMRRGRPGRLDRDAALPPG